MLNTVRSVVVARSRQSSSSSSLRSIRRQSTQNNAEQNLIKILRRQFPRATDIAVVDISGGCGSMYEVYVESPDFKGLRMVKQHQMVTDALKAEIKDMHGLRISTAVKKEK